ncbi:MAG: DNA/RNA nuclease SfsA [Ruminococcus sp.]|nr:DNA/RNA nuclease SfsA [Ruminococcus sp.]
MKYKNIHKGVFKSRPNRFIANVDINGQIEVCHVKNTGRCKELLISNATVYLEKSDNSNRKTHYDLIAVEKGRRLINMDSQIPNRAVEEWIKAGGLLGYNPFVKPESKFGDSRFDFYVESESSDRKAYVEVKGCTLECSGIAKFPDAPTVRGVKHINELIKCVEAGFEAYIIFLIQMSDVKYFTPNYETHPEFGEALKDAQKKGVKILAFDSIVTPDSIVLNKSVNIKL